jgi:hypothetical protein
LYSGLKTLKHAQGVANLRAFQYPATRAVGCAGNARGTVVLRQSVTVCDYIQCATEWHQSHHAASCGISVAVHSVRTLARAVAGRMLVAPLFHRSANRSRREGAVLFLRKMYVYIFTRTVTVLQHAHQSAARKGEELRKRGGMSRRIP